MILTFDKDNNWWIFESATEKYFYEQDEEESKKIRNLIAEFPEFLQQHIKLNKPRIKIEEERFINRNKIRKCCWVRFLIEEKEEEEKK